MNTVIASMITAQREPRWPNAAGGSALSGREAGAPSFAQRLSQSAADIPALQASDGQEGPEPLIQQESGAALNRLEEWLSALPQPARDNATLHDWLGQIVAMFAQRLGEAAEGAAEGPAEGAAEGPAEGAEGTPMEGDFATSAGTGAAHVLTALSALMDDYGVTDPAVRDRVLAALAEWLESLSDSERRFVIQRMKQLADAAKGTKDAASQPVSRGNHSESGRTAPPNHSAAAQNAVRHAVTAPFQAEPAHVPAELTAPPHAQRLGTLSEGGALNQASAGKGKTAYTAPQGPLDRSAAEREVTLTALSRASQSAPEDTATVPGQRDAAHLSSELMPKPHSAEAVTGGERTLPAAPAAAVSGDQSSLHSPSAARPPMMRTPNHFTEQLQQHIVRRLHLNPTGVSEARLSLYPEHLGQVDVRLSSHNGVLTAHFIAETWLGKELLEGQLEQLRQSLQNQGLQVSKLDVSVGEHGRSFRHAAQHGAHQQPSSADGPSTHETEGGIADQVESYMARETSQVEAWRNPYASVNYVV